MAKNGNDINSLIKEAIDASVDFEELMDSIDFNSYLEEDKENINQDDPRWGLYDKYINRINEACGYCEKLIDRKKDTVDEKLISELFEAKKKRLDARKRSKRKEEKKLYIETTHKLHRAFDQIEIDYFTANLKGKNFTDYYNWAKVLYYNEFAICYSGLAESSMSLGYAERSISLLKKIYPGIDSWEGVSDQDIKLYTFALYNKGEAERLLHNENLSLKTFEKIIKIYEVDEHKDKEFSDYYYALLRMTSILIDQGRGEEAISCLDKIKSIDSSDYRIQERDMERVSALIDQREYKDTSISAIFEEYKKEAWKDTFTQRKAALCEIRLLLERRKNKPSEFGSNEFVNKYNKVPQTIKGILIQCIKRKDDVNFKKACKYLSEYHASPSVNERQEALKGYFCYLRHRVLLKDPPESTCKFLNTSWKELESELKNQLPELRIALGNIEDEDYLSKFFKGYIEYLQGEDKEIAQDFLVIIDKLYIILSKLYREENQLQKMEEIERKYNTFKELIGPEEEIKIDREAAEFITKRFFKTIPTKDKPDRVYLSTNTIENRMRRNTDNFADKILGTSKHILPSANEGVKGILIVLRRWNSFTPSLSSPASPSRGGGYFLYFKDGNGKNKGIVIDPGYDFLDNLFLEGFTINDIDVVLISHAHPDHTDNFPKMLTLFHEMNGRLNERKTGTMDYNRKHIKIILSQGVFDLFSKQMVYSKESLQDIYVVDTKKRELIKCCKGLEIKAVRTSHGDLSQWESIGFIFNIENNKGKTTKIGYTSDARWSDEFGRNFSDCSIICAHLGSIINILKGKDFCNTFCSKRNRECMDKEYENNCKKSNFSKAKVGIDELKKQNQDENHLYLGGLTSFFNSILKNGSNLKLGIISEFGEELKGGIRMDLFHKFDDWFRNRKGKSELIHSRCLPGDIGLRVDIFSGDVFCQTCERYVDRKKINPIAYGKEEAIFFVCDECKSVLSTYQIEQKLKDYYENGRKLELADESK